MLSASSIQILLLLSPAALSLCGQPAQSSAEPIKLGDITVAGSVRSRLYTWDWFQPAAGNNTYGYSGNIFRIAFSQTRESWEWSAEFAIPFLLGLPANANGTGPQQGALGLGSNYTSANSASQNTALIFPKQVYVRLKDIGGRRLQSLRIGRFEFLDGSEITPKSSLLAAVKRDRINQRLIGPFGFSDVGRSFDGVHYSYGSTTRNFTLIAAVPTRGVYQVDGWGWNRIGFGYASYTHEWASGRHSADTRVFAIEYDDFRHILKADNRSLAARRADLGNIRINTFGLHSLHSLETGAGTVYGLFWGAFQTGRWGVQEHRAGAIDIEGGVQMKAFGKLKPVIGAGFTSSSGDGNPNDGKHETFFQLLPTPRPFARFPFFNMMNNQDAYAILQVRPGSKLAISSEYHSLRLANASDLWYGGGGAFQPWTFGYTGRLTSGRRSLANLYDSSVDFRVNRNLGLTAYFGYAQGLAVMEKIYPLGKDARFGYLEFNYRF